MPERERGQVKQRGGRWEERRRGRTWRAREWGVGGKGGAKGERRAFRMSLRSSHTSLLGVNQ